MNSPVIQLRDVTKTFHDGEVALKGLEMTVEEGSVFGLMGRNGCGKTTALKIIMGLLHPDHGSVRVLGHDLWEAPRSIRSRIAYVPQGQQLHGWMTLQELCRYVGHFYERWDMAYAEKLAREWEIPWKRKTGSLSCGEQRKAALLLAFVAEPALMVLDEPAAGFDVVTRRHLIDLLVDTVSRLQPCTILMTTHIVTDLERVASHVGLMDRGRMDEVMELGDLIEQSRKVQVVFDGAAPPADFRIPGAFRQRVEGSVITGMVRLTHEGQLDSIRQLPGARLQCFPLGFEEIILERYGGESGAHPEAPWTARPL